MLTIFCPLVEKFADTLAERKAIVDVDTRGDRRLVHPLLIFAFGAAVGLVDLD